MDMDRKTIGRIATMSLMLGVSTIGCTPGGQGGHPATLAGQAPKPDKPALRLAAQARAALAAHKSDAAVAAAEQAVALQPNDAGYRMLLGQSYLAAGRFASARASFHDSLTLSPDQPKAQFDLALAQIAQGDGADAQVVLHALNGAIPSGDVGLALVLAGDRQGGIAMLTDLVRSGKSDPRSRQNLALAFALDGRWREARAVAMQDTTPDKIDAQLAHWAELARPTATGSTQVASMLGVRPVADQGLPTALALMTPQAAAIPAALAAADTPPPIAPGGVPAVETAANSITVPLDAPLPAETPADAPAAQVVLAAQTHEARANLAPPPLLRAPATPLRSAVLVQPGRAPLFRSSGYVVQLGAYSRAGAIQTAWSQASKLMPRLAGFAAARAEFSFSGASLVRLSVSGFADRAGAVGLCTQIRSRGGECFVRQSAGDSAIQWARRDTGVQLASRG
jgi:Flp pilus assembly protein TadD